MEELWKHHAKYYDFFQNNFSQYSNTIELFCSELAEYNHILDNGAGTGNLTLELLKNNHQVTAIDIDSSSLEILREKVNEKQYEVSVQVVDGSTLPYQNESFDGVASMFVIPFVENIYAYFEEAYRILKPNGKLVLSAWSPVEGAEKLRDVVIEELTEKNILPKYQNEWNHIQQSDNTLLDEVLHAPNVGTLIEKAEKVGFKNVNYIENAPYGKYAYFLVGNK